MKKVIIIGKKNVGKSTLFNLLTKSKKSTTINYEGYTRDCISSITKIKSSILELIDTAGFGYEKTELDYKTIKKTWDNIKNSDIILFMIESNEFYDKVTENLIKLIKKLKKDTLYLINKIDKLNYKELESLEIKINKNNTLLISIKHNKNINDLLTIIEKKIENQKKIENNFKNIITLSVVGRPNVGKSSTINKIIKVEKLLVDDISGTTRDSIFSDFIINKIKYKIIDTPGIKKNIYIKSNIDSMLIKNAVNSIKISDIVILVTDINSYLNYQDKKIITNIKKYNKNILISINKCDLKNKNEIIKINDDIKVKSKDLIYTYTSSKYGFGIENIKEKINRIKNFEKKIINKKDIYIIMEKIIKENKIKIKNIILKKYKPLIINITLDKKENISNNKKKYIISKIINYLKLNNISIKFLFKNA